MTIDLSQFHQVFFEETDEHLASMESLLLAIDIAQPDAEDLNAIFRAAHSIKGGAATFGFSDLTELTHILENLLDRVRKGTMSLTTALVDASLHAKDALAEMLAAHRAGGEADPAGRLAVQAELEAFLPAGGVAAPVAAATVLPAAEAGPVSHQLYLEVGAGAVDSIDSLLEQLGREGEATLISAADPERDVPWVLQMQTPLSVHELSETLGFVLPPDSFHVVDAHIVEEDESFGLFDAIEPPAADAEGGADAGFGLFEPLAAGIAFEEGGFGLFEPLAAAVPGEAEAPAEAVAQASPVASAPAVHRAVDKAQAESSIRVNIEKVDLLLNLVGELVITQSMLVQSASELDAAAHERLLNGVAMLQRNSRELQEAVMSIRMTPIASVFNRFPRVIRDLTAKLDKQVELSMLGEHTELDKSFIEKLADPLTHLVRNSLDHGIETPEIRVAKGKPAVGRLLLRAYHQGGSIVIEVTDDGAGLNRERILGKARERGLAVNDGMSDSEVWSLIFDPGFSTASVVTDVSGRGVGMDVVRRNIQSMGGRVDIESMLDFGTTISIRLPLTLAILDGMSVRIGREIYILPLSLVVESLQPRLEDVKNISGQGMVVNVRGEYLPIVPLAELFEIEDAERRATSALLVIVESDASRVALLVDDLVGQQQFVVKNLETNYHKVDGLAGATILGDGQVALILDVTTIVRNKSSAATLRAMSEIS
ncbi:chemotaxis protein CheW [Paludibacterium yongneupense]|uniref:chemotaxis protein CheW n=1 Tax=Paludibacterium yongneupense TaxID=400061 RepID=UPI00041EFA28|nr:chemotaxis protein CheW [Paludibacterium yongneupense]